MIEHYILDNIHLLDGRNIKIETGVLAKQSNGSVVISMGNTMLLATVITDKERKEDVDILPLTIDYRHNNYAFGKIPGGFIKREGRSSEDEILIMRVVDRVLRPLFPKNKYTEIQVIIYLLSFDKVLPNGLAALAASVALFISDIPYYGPVSEIRLVRLNSGKLVINPCLHEVLNSDIDMIIGGSKESIIVIEGEMKEVSEEEMLDAIIYAHIAIKNQIETQIRVAKRVKKNRIKRFYHFYQENKDILNKYSLDKEILKFFKKKEQNKFIHNYYFQFKKELIRGLIIRENYRIDGRASKDIRHIYGILDYLPSTHGSAFFIRGETHALASVTLGAYQDIHNIDSFLKEVNERFYLHYNFPPFSTGNIRRIRGVSRREVGHGNLALSALKNIITENTPYTIRVVSDILGSNGSSSMATVCAGALALINAGITIKSPVSGIAMGLILDKQKKKEIILSDIIGDEDYIGDMDLKMAGTKKGITACQMDLKIEGISYNLLRKVFIQAYHGRIFILNKMLKTLSMQKISMKQNITKIVNINIPNESISCIIGPGGKTIQEIQKKTYTCISIKEKGKFGIVEIIGKKGNKINQATDCIKNISFNPKTGSVFDAKVKSIKDFGAFVEILPGKEYLLHRSEIKWECLKRGEDVLRIGDTIKVKFMEIDNISRKIRLSRIVLLPNIFINK